LGEDNADWNKLCGVYRWGDYRKNKNAVMIGWRPYLEQPGVIEICMYENVGGANRPGKITCTVPTGTRIDFTFHELGGKYRIEVSGFTLGIQTNPMQFKSVGKIYTWFGGNQTAPQDMALKLGW
jgi:hypothetical protein